MATPVDRYEGPTLEISGPTEGEESIPLGSTEVLGRGETATIYVPGQGVSRPHAEIVETDRGHRLSDLDSTNGTWVNGRRLAKEEKHLLRDGDDIRLGQSEIALVFRNPERPTLEQAVITDVPTIVDIEQPTAPEKESRLAPEPVPLDADASAEEEIFEGKVNLQIEGGIGPLISLHRQISTLHYIRLLRFSDTREGAEASIELPEPVAIQKVLSQLDGVSEVIGGTGAAKGGVPAFTVRLG